MDLSALLHELDSLGPTRDDAVQREGDRLITLVGAVEFLPVDRGATIVNQHGIGGLGALAVTFRDHLVLQAAGSGLHAWLGGVFLEEGLAFLEIGVGVLCHKGGGAERECREGEGQFVEGTEVHWKNGFIPRVDG